MSPSPPSSPTRRQFLKQSGSTLAGATALGGIAPQLLFGRGPDSVGRNRSTLVTIYLRGGADPLNTLVPYGDGTYYKIRPTIAIPRPGTKDRRAVLPLNEMFGLHPSMEPLLPLFKQGLIAPIVNVGSPHQTRSHFDAQDFMERAAPGVRTITEGWLNRFLSATRSNDDSEFRALSLQPTLPRSLRGQHPVLAVPSIGIEHTINTFESLYSCTEDKHMQAAAAVPQTAAEQMRRQVTDAGASTIKLIRELRRIITTTDRQGATYPGGGFAKQLRDLAKLIKADKGLEIAALDYGGWDHHAFQGGTQGTMSTMLGDVSKALAAFVEDLGPRMNRVLVLFMSEFGRTANENGTNGTDHGHGGHMLAVGGMVKGRKVYGKWTGLEEKSLYQGRDMPVHTDFRQVFAESLQDLYGFDAFKNNFFPGYNHKAKPLDFLKPVG